MALWAFRQPMEIWGFREPMALWAFRQPMEMQAFRRPMAQPLGAFVRPIPRAIRLRRRGDRAMARSSPSWARRYRRRFRIERVNWQFLRTTGLSSACPKRRFRRAKRLHPSYRCHSSRRVVHRHCPLRSGHRLLG